MLMKYRASINSWQKENWVPNDYIYVQNITSSKMADQTVF